MARDLEKDTYEAIQGLCKKIAVDHSLDGRIHEALQDHIEDKLLAYLDREELVSRSFCKSVLVNSDSVCACCCYSVRFNPSSGGGVALLVQLRCILFPCLLCMYIRKMLHHKITHPLTLPLLMHFDELSAG